VIILGRSAAQHLLVPQDPHPPIARPFLTLISLSIETFLICVYGSSSPSDLHENLSIFTALLLFSFSILSQSNRQNETLFLFSNFLLLQFLLAIFAEAYSQPGVLNSPFVHSLRVFLSAPKVNGTVYNSVRSCKIIQSKWLSRDRSSHIPQHKLFHTSGRRKELRS
jgi:hypothetical protein